jgi:hypothetical protein
MPRALLSLLLTVIFPIICGCSSPPRAESHPLVTPISWRDINEKPVIGMLGLPLGTTAELQATVVSGDSLRTKQDEGEYLLMVTGLPHEWWALRRD